MLSSVLKRFFLPFIVISFLIFSPFVLSLNTSSVQSETPFLSFEKNSVQAAPVPVKGVGTVTNKAKSFLKNNGGTLALFGLGAAGAAGLVLNAEAIARTIIGWVSGISLLYVYITSMVFDNFLAISLSTEFFNLDFIAVAWSNIRDIVNIAFIFGAIYVSYLLMTEKQVGGRDWKKSLINLIVVVFILNFSLFFARVIVDAGNLSARVFYNAIAVELVVENGESQADAHFAIAKTFYTDEEGNGQAPFGFKTVGGAFYSYLQPDSLISDPAMFSQFNDEGSPFVVYFVIMAILIVVNIFTANALFKAGFMFIGRIIHIMIYMITAPVFFLSLFLPMPKSLDFKENWLKPLFMRSFCIVIYLAMLWISLLFLQSGIMDKLDKVKLDSDNEVVLGFSGVIIVIVIFAIKAMMVIYTLSKAGSIGRDTCEGGKTSAMSILGKGLGAAIKYTGAEKIIRGVGGVVGRQAVGRFAGGALTGEFAQKMAVKGGISGILGNKLMDAGMKLEDTKFGGKTYKETYKERQEVENKRQSRMSKEMQEERKKNLLGIGTDGSLKEGVTVSGFKNRDEQKAYLHNTKGAADGIRKILDDNSTTEVEKQDKLEKIGYNENIAIDLVKTNTNKDKASVDEIIKSAAQKRFLDSSIGKRFLKKAKVEDIATKRGKSLKDFLFISDSEERTRLENLNEGLGVEDEKVGDYEDEIAKNDASLISNLKQLKRDEFEFKNEIDKMINAEPGKVIKINEILNKYKGKFNIEKDDQEFVGRQIKDMLSVQDKGLRKDMAKSITNYLGDLSDVKSETLNKNTEMKNRVLHEKIEEITKQKQEMRTEKGTGKIGIGGKHHTDMDNK